MPVSRKNPWSVFRIIPAIFTAMLLGATGAEAEEQFLVESLDNCREGFSQQEIKQPNYSKRHRFRSGNRPSINAMARVVLDAPGEAYVFCESFGGGVRPYYPTHNSCNSPSIAVRTDTAGEITGRLIQPFHERVLVVPLKFKTQANPNARNSFLRAKKTYYDMLFEVGVSGTSWFRYQSRVAANELGEVPKRSASLPPRREAVLSQLEKSFDLLSGGRALSENLQLDRELLLSEIKTESISLESISGVEVRAFDWKPLIGESVPKLDTLATQIPFDQYAVFSPSFSALEMLMDEAHKSFGEALRAFEARSEFVNVREKYQAQICLPLSEFGKAMARLTIQNIAITGSDTYFRTGTDVAVLMEATNPTVVLEAIRLNQKSCLAANGRGNKISGSFSGVAYEGVMDESRVLSSFLAEIKGVVIVTNSLSQLEKLVKVSTGALSPLSELDEYRFFRKRYVLGEPDEQALMVVSDAAIRKWTGPKWRILASRRTLASAELSELQSQYIDEIYKGSLSKRQVAPSESHRVLGNFSILDGGIKSETYGTLDFLTPISELPIESVSTIERDAYKRFRDTYSSYWKNYFDPIAIRVRKTSQTLELDTTVMPLILGTDYAMIRDFVGRSQLDRFSGDPRPDSILELTSGIDVEYFQRLPQHRFVGTFLPGLANPLGWIGSSATIGIDGGEFWNNLVKAEDAEQFIEKNIHEIPLTAFIEVKDSMKLAAFVGAVKGFSDQGTPGFLSWETKTYKEQSYTVVSEAESKMPSTVRSQSRMKWKLAYAATPEVFLLSVGEAPLLRSLDRLRERPNRPEKGETAFLSGSNFGVKVRREFLEPGGLFDESYVDLLQERCLGNIPILNEWKRRYPDQDPVAVHRKLWKTTPVCHAGGEYRWNETWKTMESTLFGHPAQPRRVERHLPSLDGIVAARFALQFEHDGLRAKMSLDKH